MSTRATFAEYTKFALTSLRVPSSRAKAHKLEMRAPLQIHLGSARNRLPGWVNIDLFRPGRSLDLYWDLRRGLPFSEGSVDGIFSEHLFEHLTYEQGVELMRECRRVLKPGGVMRTGVPDLERYVLSYLGKDDLIDIVRPGRVTRALALNEPFFLHGHQCMYDFETLKTALMAAGFAVVELSFFGGGRIHPNVDSVSRRNETLYVDAKSTTCSEVNR